MKLSEYERQAIDFLAKTNTDIDIQYLKTGKHFEDDKVERDIYKVTFTRGNRSFSLQFGQSLANSKKWRDRLNGNIFLLNGRGENNRFRVVSDEYLNDFCDVIPGEEPTAYDILACIQKYDVGTFKDFCGEFGYDEDSRKAEKIYKAVLQEFNNVQKIWSDEEIEELQEIQ